MSDLVAFLRAQLDKDRQIAVDASGRAADWVIEAETAPYAWGADPVDENVLAGGKPIARVDWEYGGILNALHIARHDPARVLREVEAKRRIVDDIIPWVREGEDRIDGEWGLGSWATDAPDRPSVQILRLLALPYSDHPDYDPAWAPSVDG